MERMAWACTTWTTSWRGTAQVSGGVTDQPIDTLPVEGAVGPQTLATRHRPLGADALDGR